MLLEKKVVIMTGCSSGVGRAAALRFAQEGAKVYAVARREALLQELSEQAHREGFAGTIVPAAGDVSRQEDIDRIVRQVQEEEGRLDILVSNAGIMDAFEPVTQTSDETFDRVWDVNVRGPFRLLRSGIPLMKEGGSIVIVSSVAGLRGGKAGTSYTVSKHALNGLGKNTAAMYAAQGIRTNIVAPGGIQTDIITDFSHCNQDGLAVIGNGPKVPKMMASAEEIAENVLYLASDLSSNLNGVVLVSDGGLVNL